MQLVKANNKFASPAPKCSNFIGLSDKNLVKQDRSSINSFGDISVPDTVSPLVNNPITPMTAKTTNIRILAKKTDSELISKQAKSQVENNTASQPDLAEMLIK